MGTRDPIPKQESNGILVFTGISFESDCGILQSSGTVTGVVDELMCDTGELSTETDVGDSRRMYCRNTFYD